MILLKLVKTDVIWLPYSQITEVTFRYFCKLLAPYFNRSFDASIFRGALKLAEISPFLQTIKSYRKSTSILQNLSNFLEGFLYQEVYLLLMILFSKVNVALGKAAGCKKVC